MLCEFCGVLNVDCLLCVARLLLNVCWVVRGACWVLCSVVRCVFQCIFVCVCCMCVALTVACWYVYWCCVL